MKKITPKILMMMCLLSTYIGSSQTLNQFASWPNANWTLSGTFTAVGLLSDPTGADTTFGFDDDAAGNGSFNDLQATSPVIDLTAASTAGEIWLTISSDFVYREFGGDVLNIEIYDADAMTWTAVQTFSGNSTNTDYQTCNTTAYITPVINISAYTATQLLGFQYRITYDDVDGYQWGFCITSPTIVSGAPCSVPDTLFATTITETSADFGWTENGTATSWNIELVDVTAGGTFTGTPTTSGVTTTLYNQTGLVGDNEYRFFVQADCGIGTSMWAGPFRFSSQYIPVAPDCTNGIFLDSGGITGTYGFSETITYTICPTTPGDNVEVEFTVFSTENNGTAACFDGLTIHDGADATATTVDPPGGGTIWCHDTDTAEGTGDLLGQTITSTDASGCLTFVFTSDDTVQLDGWEAIVNCATLSTITFDNGRAFTYFPNPVDTKLTLVAGKKIENVTVYNILGAQVLTTSPNALTKDIDTSKLTAGTYFVQVTVDGATDTVKIIKQ